MINNYKKILCKSAIRRTILRTAGLLAFFTGMICSAYASDKPAKTEPSPKILLIGANEPSSPFHIRVALNIATKLKDRNKAEVDILFVAPFGGNDAWIFSLREKLYAELRTRNYDAIIVNHWAGAETMESLKAMTLTNIPIITYFTNAQSLEREEGRRKSQNWHNHTMLTLGDSQLDNLKLALALDRGIHDVFFCTNGFDEAFEQNIEAWKNKNAPGTVLHFAYCDRMTLEELEQQIHNIPGRPAIIMNTAWYDMTSGKSIPYETFIDRMKKSASQEPLFLSGNILGLEYGCSAGYAVSFDEYGDQLSRLAARVLEQKRADDIAPVRLIPSPYANYHIFQQAGLPFHAMPKETVWLNEPQNFFFVHRYVIAVAGSIILILMGFILMLYFNRRRILKLNEQLRKSKAVAEESQYAAQLEASQFRCTIESIGDAVIVTDPRERITLVNLVAAQLIGESAEKLVGCPLSEKFRIHNYLTGEHVVSPLTKAITEKTIVTLSNHVDLDALDGKSYHIADCASPIFDPDGKVTGGVLIFRDVTSDYEKRDQLKNAMEAALAADKAKSYFLATMSHEIRTPLNAVIGFTELLATGSISPEEQPDIIHSINVAGNALLSLINDVLDISKLEAGQLKIHQTLCDASDLVHEICAIFTQKAAQKGIGISVSVDDKMPLVFVDAPRVKQILLNLIGNAVKFTHYGEIAIHVRFAPADAENGTISFAVTDTGIGISKEFLPRLFQPFTQADSNHASRKYEGTGLGLAISDKLAKAMDGELSVVSAEGKGSTFTLSLRKVRFQMNESHSGQQHASKENTSVSIKRSILLVDDVQSNLKILEHMLRSVGISTQSAASPKEALKLIETQHFDMILTDIWMPEMNGYELMKEIRRNPGRENFKIIAVTADSDVQTSFDMSDFDDVIIKPVTRDKLCDVLKKISQ